MSPIQSPDVATPSLPIATHSQVPLLPLPLELWLEIFSFACYIPGLLDTSDSRAIEAYSNDSNGILLDKMVSASMTTKKSISEVCRCWWWCMQPLLFEHVRVRSGAHALVVAKRLDEQREVGGELCHPGRWVKRVEIHSADQYWDEERSEAMVRILSSSPNVSVFSDLFCCGPSSILDHQPLLDQLVQLCKQGSLRRLEWYSGSPGSLNGLLSKAKNLEALIVGRGYISSELDAQIDLPRLTTLVAGEYASSCRFQDVHCPLLKSLVVHRSLMPLSKFDIRNHFAIVGDVQHMRLQFDDWRTNYIQLEEFTALNSLAFNLDRRLVSNSIKDLVHKRLARLEFYNFILFNHVFNLSDCHSRDSWAPLREFMFKVLDKKKLPSLKSIGFYVPEKYFSHGPIAPATQELEEFWLPWIEACRLRKIHVEMSLGGEAHVCGTWKPFSHDIIGRFTHSGTLSF